MRVPSRENATLVGQGGRFWLSVAGFCFRARGTTTATRNTTRLIATRKPATTVRRLESRPVVSFESGSGLGGVSIGRSSRGGLRRPLDVIRHLLPNKQRGPHPPRIHNRPG